MAAVLAISVILAAQTTNVAGWATYDPGQRPGHAAAGPALRKMLGKDWRGSLVEVTSGGNSITVVVDDWCACGERHGTPTVIDLRPSDFARLQPTWKGVIPVRVRRTTIALPPTDTE